MASPTERVTVDLGLAFAAGTGETARFDRLAIAEVKGGRHAATWFRVLARDLGLRVGGGVSKYCLGVISLERPARQGRFRDVLARISHTMDQHDPHFRDR